MKHTPLIALSTLFLLACEGAPVDAPSEVRSAAETTKDAPPDGEESLRLAPAAEVLLPSEPKADTALDDRIGELLAVVKHPRSALVVVGTVISAETTLVPQRSDRALVPATGYTLRVHRSYKTASPSTVTFWSLGGEIQHPDGSKEALDVSGALHPDVGSELIVTLTESRGIHVSPPVWTAFNGELGAVAWSKDRPSAAALAKAVIDRFDAELPAFEIGE